MTKPKRVLIAGASGFIGRNMAEFFAEFPEYEVYGTYFKSKPWSHPRIKMLQVDLTAKEEVSKVLEGVDILIQAAATTSGAKDIVGRPYLHVTDNAIMNSLIFRAAFEQKVSQVVFFSCTVMYPGNAQKLLKEEDFDQNKIEDKYFGVGWTKVYLEKMAEFYSSLDRTKFTIIRHSNIYGPHDKFDLDKSHVFGATVNKVLHSKDGIIRVWGDGSEERDLLYVSDLVEFVRSSILKQEENFELFNVGQGISVSIDTLVKKIVSASKLPVSIQYDPLGPTIKTKVALDISKAYQKLGWKPKVNLDDGIVKTLEWYRANL